MGTFVLLVTGFMQDTDLYLVLSIQPVITDIYRLMYHESAT